MHKTLFPILIRNSDFALSFRNEKELLRDLPLPNNHLFRIIHNQLHLGEEDVDQLFVVLEHFIGFDDVLKDEFDNLLLKTWRDILYKQRELLLVLLTLLRVL